MNIDRIMDGLEITTVKDITLVKDGSAPWLCETGHLERAKSLAARLPSNMDDGEAYGCFCGSIRGPVAAIYGRMPVSARALVFRAVAAGVIDTDHILYTLADQA